MSDETHRIYSKLDSINFNIDHGYLEGIVRGFKSGILKQTDYLNLTQCDTLEGKYLPHCVHFYLINTYEVDYFISQVLC